MKRNIEKEQWEAKYKINLSKLLNRALEKDFEWTRFIPFSKSPNKDLKW